MKITINDKEFNVQVAETPEEHKKGLQDVHYLPENEGMLFVFDNEEKRSFWMKDTFIPLDIIGINDDLEVTSVNKGTPEDETMIEFDAQYVLELNEDSGVKIGDEIEFPEDYILEDDEDETEEKDEDDSEEDTKKLPKMLVLDAKGKVQMELDGGERIFSRKNTRVLVKLAVHANKTKKDIDYKKLGKKVFKFLDIQESNEPQYVELTKEDKK